DRAFDTPEAWFELSCLNLLAEDRTGFQRSFASLRRCVEGSDVQRDIMLSVVAAALGDAPDLAKTIAEGEKLSGVVKRRDLRAVLNMALGLAHYRAGRPEQSLKWLSESLAASKDWQLASQAWLVLALVHKKLGQAPEAEKALAESESLFPRNDAGTSSADSRPNHLHPCDWLSYVLLRREASAALKQ